MKVLKDFRDKLTDDYYKVDSTYVSVDAERIKELADLGYIEAPIESVPEVKLPEVTDVKPNQSKPKKIKA